MSYDENDDAGPSGKPTTSTSINTKIKTGTFIDIDEIFSDLSYSKDLDSLISDDSYEIIALARFVEPKNSVNLEKNFVELAKTISSDSNVISDNVQYEECPPSIKSPTCPAWLHANQKLPGSYIASYPAAESALLVLNFCPDKGFWAWLTCSVAFVTRFITSGLCFSLLGLNEQHFGFNFFYCHLLIFNLVSAVTVPLTDVFVNVHGYRVVLTIGGGFLILWSLFLTMEYISMYKIALGILGGIGAGTMNTSYTLLLSTLFAKRRHLVHGIIRSGEILGLITIPEVIKGYFSYHGNHASMFYTTSTFILLVISLFIAIPYPFELKLFDDDNEPLGNRNIEQLNARLAAFNFRIYDEKYPWVNYPTVNQTIGIRRSYLVLLTKKTQRTKRMPDLREEIRDKKTDDWLITQNFTNYFSKPSPSGIRPLYRDDIHFEGNINLFFSLTEKQTILDYHKSVSRLITVEDIYRPYRKAIWQVTKDPIRRSIVIVFDVRGIEFMTYVILLGVDGIVNFVFNAILTSYLMLADKLYMHTTHDSFMLICLGLLLGQFIGYNWWEKEAINVSYNVSFLCVFASGLAIQSNVQSRYKIVKILSLLIYGLFTELFYCSMKSIYCYRINKMRSTQFHTYVTLVRGITSTISLMWIGKMIQPIVNTKEITSFGSKTLLCNAFFLFFGHMYLDYRKIKS